MELIFLSIGFPPAANLQRTGRIYQGWRDQVYVLISFFTDKYTRATNRSQLPSTYTHIHTCPETMRVPSALMAIHDISEV